MEVTATAQAPNESEADTVALALFDDEEAPAPLAELAASGEGRSSFKSLSLAHDGGKRWLGVGLGKRSELTPERARVAASAAVGRARELGARTLCWQAPGGADVAGALVEGTMLGDYRF